MDLSKVSFTVVALLVGAACLSLGLTGGFIYASANVHITELWARIAVSFFGVLILGSSFAIEFYRRISEGKEESTKAEVESNPTGGKVDEVTAVRLIALDEDASYNFSEIAKGSRRVSILSRTAVNLLSQYFQDFENIINDNGTVRLLVVDPESEVCKWLYDGPPEVVAQNLSTVRYHIEQLRMRCGHRFEVRTMVRAPTFGLVWLEKRASAPDVLYVQIYFLYGPGNRKRPIIVLPVASHWYSVFIDDFEKIWAGARPWT